MDELTTAATLVWHEDENTARQWFDLVCEVVDAQREQGELGWDALRDDLVNSAAQRGFATTAEDFAAALDAAGSPTQTLEMMADRRDELPAAYLQAWAQAGAAAVEDGPAPGSSDPTEDDPDVWNAFLAANGPLWDGAEESWQAFRDWFAYQAAEQGVGASATAFCDYAEAAGKIATFAQYGLPTPTLPAETVEGSAEGDEPDAGESIDSMLAEFRDNYPEFADVSDSEALEALAEFVAEYSGAATSAS